MYELQACVRGANENAGNLIFVVQFLMRHVIGVLYGSTVTLPL